MEFTKNIKVPICCSLNLNFGDFDSFVELCSIIQKTPMYIPNFVHLDILKKFDMTSMSKTLDIFWKSPRRLAQLGPTWLDILGTLKKVASLYRFLKKYMNKKLCLFNQKDAKMSKIFEFENQHIFRTWYIFISVSSYVKCFGLKIHVSWGSPIHKFI